MKNPIPKDLFDILACPICRADLRYSKDKKHLICIKYSHKYPIQQGIPILLSSEEAKKKK